MLLHDAAAAAAGPGLPPLADEAPTEVLEFAFAPDEAPLRVLCVRQARAAEREAAPLALRS